jgi:hypothetical protein
MIGTKIYDEFFNNNFLIKKYNKNINFFVIYNKKNINYFENYYQVVYFTNYYKGIHVIWHCSKYLNTPIKLTIVKTSHKF